MKMFRSRSWFGGGLWKPKNPHSLEHLKYVYLFQFLITILNIMLCLGTYTMFCRRIKQFLKITEVY